MSYEIGEDSDKTDEAGIHAAGHLEHAYQLGLRIRPFALLFDAGFTLLFVFLKVWPLAATFLAMLVYHLWMHRESHLRSDRHNAALPWVWVVIFVQSLLSVWVLGAGAGFQYYLLATIPPGFAILHRPLSLKLLQAGVIVVFYLACDVWFDRMQPLYVLSDSMLSAIRHVNIVGMCALLAGTSYAHSLLIKEAGDALRRIASTDELTGLLNRRSFSEIIERETARSQRGSRPLTLVLGDIDFFKRINDTHGHAAGDHVLQSVSNLLQGAVREYDCVARWGGEEFVILLPDTGLAAAKQIAERLREMVAGSHPSFEGQLIPVSMTLGVAQFSGEENWHAIVARADEALYRGKAAGRNRVEVA